MTTTVVHAPVDMVLYQLWRGDEFALSQEIPASWGEHYRLLVPSQPPASYPDGYEWRLKRRPAGAPEGPWETIPAADVASEWAEAWAAQCATPTACGGPGNSDVRPTGLCRGCGQ